MKFVPPKQGLPDGFKLVLADVGSAGGLHQRWRAVRPFVSAMLFDPREGGETKRSGDDTIYPFALGEEKGTATLNITALPNMSSTLLPNRALLQSFRKKGRDTVVQSTLDMPVDTLDAIAATDHRHVDVIKVDTQGTELPILRGARECLSSSVIAAEVEVSFFQRYEGQATAREIIAFMAEAGFDLMDIYRPKRYRRISVAGIANRSMGGGQRAGRLAYADGIFFLNEDRLLARIAALPASDGEAVVLKAMIGFLIYGKPDMASHLFDKTEHLFDPARRTIWARYFKRLARGPFRSGIFHHIADYAARHV